MTVYSIYHRFLYKSPFLNFALQRNNLIFHYCRVYNETALNIGGLVNEKYEIYAFS